MTWMIQWDDDIIDIHILDYRYTVNIDNDYMIE